MQNVIEMTGVPADEMLDNLEGKVSAFGTSEQISQFREQIRDYVPSRDGMLIVQHFGENIGIAEEIKDKIKSITIATLRRQGVQNSRYVGTTFYRLVLRARATCYTDFEDDAIYQGCTADGETFYFKVWTFRGTGEANCCLSLRTPEL